MTAEQFAYWLQGHAELSDGPPGPEQWQAIREHLALVFNKVAPAWDDQPAMRALRVPTAADVPLRWKYPASHLTGYAVAGDTEARLVC